MTESESGLKPYLSEAINYATDIEPYRFIQLYAGVGAGKNEFIMKFITGNPKLGIPPLNVLLITSRKSKVIETLNDYGQHITQTIGDERTIEEIMCNPHLSVKPFERTIEDTDDFEITICQRSIICTNAYIEKYHQYCFNPAIEATHLWNRFDVIVWDEAHSLVMDSSYQRSPYHVIRFLNETYRRMFLSVENEKLPESERDPAIKRPTCQRIIIMTGTPAPLSGISFPDSAHLLDMREKCRNVSPRNIHFIDSIQAQIQIKSQLKNGERIVYFSNHIILPDDAAETYEIPVEKVAVSFSDDSRRKMLKPPEKETANEKVRSDQPENNYDRMVNVEKYLSEHSLLRPDIFLFLTTSRNKEGINIKNDDIRHVYIESHSITDIIQIAGRIRKGAEHVYILMDSQGYGNSEHPFEKWLDRKLCFLPSVTNDEPSQETNVLNQLLRTFCKENHIKDVVSNLSGNILPYSKEHPELGKMIDFIKSKFPHIEFDYQTYQFAFNRYRQLSQKFIAAELQKFSAAAENPSELVALFQEAFPTSYIHPYLSPQEEAKAHFLRYLEQHQETLHHIDDLLAIIADLAKILGEPKRQKQNSTTRRINHYLHQIDFHAERKGHKPASPTYDQYTITSSTDLGTPEIPAA